MDVTSNLVARLLKLASRASAYTTYIYVEVFLLQ
jgi:hypothetical protein